MADLMRALTLAATLVVSACRPDPHPTQLAAVHLDEIGIEAEIGQDGDVPPDAVLSRVVDAVFLGDTLAVLDAAPPFVKLFDRRGEFAGTRVRQGSGPGEARRPIAIERAGPRAFLVTEQKWLTHVSLDSARNGGMIRRTGGDDRVFRGAAVGCGEQLFALITANAFEAPGALTALRTPHGSPDTLSPLGPIRANSQLAQPLFIDANDHAVAFYTEEVSLPRIQVVHCPTSSVSEIRVDSLGRQQWFEETARGYALHPWEPPHPAGLAVTDSGILWATQVVAETDADSLTLVSLLPANGGVQRVVAVNGWFQVLDSDSRGHLLLGLRHPVPRVLVIRADALLDALDRHGVDRPIGRPHDEES